MSEAVQINHLPATTARVQPKATAPQASGPVKTSRFKTPGEGSSLGISIVTSICLTDADHERLAARSLAKYFPSRSYGVVVRRGKYLSPQARDFVELIRPQMLAGREYDETGDSGR